MPDTQPTISRLLAALKALHRDERGAEGIEKLLIIGAIVLPLLAVLIVFRERISNWVNGKLEETMSDADDTGTIGP